MALHTRLSFVVMKVEEGKKNIPYLAVSYHDPWDSTIPSSPHILEAAGFTAPLLLVDSAA